jgi:hypothetical protein
MEVGKKKGDWVWSQSPVRAVSEGERSDGPVHGPVLSSPGLR